MKRNLILISLLSLLCIGAWAQEFSTAGFYAIEGSPRSVYNMNPAWRFHKGNIQGAHAENFDDSSWQVVALPNGMEILPLDASAGVNYQGVAWYRKEFTPQSNKFANRRVVLHFEGVMGKAEVWVNGTSVAEHFGGYLPFSVDITSLLKLGQKNIIAVKADNSDNEDYPPGKPQAALDFSYFGGIYRDVWLYTTDHLYITDPIVANKVADGGLFIHYQNVSKQSATVNLSLNLKNETTATSSGTVEFALVQKDGKTAKNLKARYRIAKGSDQTLKLSTVVENPKLWSPDSPYLYDLIVSVKNSKGKIIDSYRQRVGIRSVEYTKEQGMILNGEPFPRKLIGANRHQDYATIGNALSNSLHWRDALKLKEAGMDLIRNAHYPQDPAFMDACAELGLFLIENTPGWQFWNDKPIFKARVYENIRDMIRRDRNYPVVIMWEPILNETWYSEDFAQSVHNICKEELPIQGNYTVSDLAARGSENLDLQYMHPYIPGSIEGYNKEVKESGKVSLTREFGDNVDNWNSHNSVSRMARNWGEMAQLKQAEHYLQPDYPFTCIDVLFRQDPSHIGGALWHSFDHQRGGHPDPFYGGIMDAFRRPKFSYEMFKSQSRQVEPMVFIANIMSPISPEDVTVYSNCEEVRLHTRYGDSIRIHKQPVRNLINQGAPSPLIVFEDAFNMMHDKLITNTEGEKHSFLLAEGLIDGKVVATHRVTPARRPEKLRLVVDTMNIAPRANGGDLITITAEVVDKDGNVKRFNNSWVKFEVSGEGRLLARNSIEPIQWGDASVIVQTSTNPGVITVRVSAATQGDYTLASDEIHIKTLPSEVPMIFDASIDRLTTAPLPSEGEVVNLETKLENAQKLKSVEKQQAEFGEQR